MGWLANLMLTIQVLSAIGIIVLVLLQQGKGADMGAAFGSGSAGSVFGSSGSANFLSRTTAVLATIFFVATLGLSFVATKSRQSGGSGSVMQPATPQDSSAVPGAPATVPLPSGGASSAPSGVPASSSVPGVPVPSTLPAKK